MVVTLGYEVSGILVLKGFIVSPVISICGLSSSKYTPFTSLFNVAWFNIVDVVVAYPIPPVLSCLVMYFWIVLYLSSIAITTFCGILIDGGFVPVPVTIFLLPDTEVGLDVVNGSSEMSSDLSVWMEFWSKYYWCWGRYKLYICCLWLNPWLWIWNYHHSWGSIYHLPWLLCT